MIPPLHITQRKESVLFGTHPNFCFARTSFMLEPLDEMPCHKLGGMGYE